MSAKKGSNRGLGRGFESLVPSDFFEESFDPTAGDDQKVSELRTIKLVDISADPDQPRQHFDDAAIKELTDSIRLHGVLQPIVVTPKKDGFEIVAGERRYRASKAAGKTTIPALVRTLSGQHKLELALIENLQRRDLNSLETATAYAKLRDQFSLSLEQIGQNVGGKSISAISNTLRLLRLPRSVQLVLAKGELSEGQARPLIDLDEKKIMEILPKLLAEQWSARKIEQTVRELKRPESTSKPKSHTESVHYKADETQLHDHLKTNVKVRETAKNGSGQIVISFKNAEEFARIKKQLL